MTTSIRAWVCLAALGLLWACEPAPTQPNTNSQTHWLSACEQDDDCHGGFSCFCGVCTVSCGAPDACGGVDAEAVCAPPVGAQVEQACASGQANTLDVGICLPPPSGDVLAEQICDLSGGADCPQGQFCHWDQAEACGAQSFPGACRDLPQECTEEFDPVCGCDDQTYSNECSAHAAGVSVASDGACADQGPDEPDEPDEPVDVTCGGLAGEGCPEGQFCDYALGDGCGEVADGQGVCQDTPEGCTGEVEPVCGCDGQTYSNACLANAAGVSVASDGACEDQEPDEPVEVACGARAGDTCAADEFCAYEEGDLCGAADAEAVCRPRPEACDQEFDPVCGCDGQTYSNACAANEAGVGVLSAGACEQEPAGCLEQGACAQGEYCVFPEADACGLTQEAPGTCQARPELCTEQSDPVCGCDGQTYENDCYAANAGVNVASAGACEVDEATCGGFLGVACPRDQFCDYAAQDMCGAADATGVCRARPEACTEEFDPVCGCDGQTYGSGCQANAAGVGVLHEGECAQ